MYRRSVFLSGYGIIAAGAVIENGILHSSYLGIAGIWGFLWMLMGIAALVWAKRSLRQSEGIFLVQHGPYAWTRNPEAAAHFFGIMPGICLILNTNIGILGIIYSIYLFLQNIDFEERELEDKFGEQYFAYKERVNLLIPCKL